MALENGDKNTIEQKTGLKQSMTLLLLKRN